MKWQVKVFQFPKKNSNWFNAMNAYPLIYSSCTYNEQFNNLFSVDSSFTGLTRRYYFALNEYYSRLHVVSSLTTAMKYSLSWGRSLSTLLPSFTNGTKTGFCSCNDYIITCKVLIWLNLNIQKYPFYDVRSNKVIFLLSV